MGLRQNCRVLQENKMQMSFGMIWDTLPAGVRRGGNQGVVYLVKLVSATSGGNLYM